MNALRDGRFRRLLFGQSVSSFGDTALYLSLAIWAKDLTGSNAAAGAVFLALGVPVLLAPLTGTLVDRVRRRPLLMATNALTGLGVLALLAVRSPAQTWIMYAVAFWYGAAAGIIGAAQTALLKDLLPDDQLASANAMLQTVSQGLRVVSPLVGAGLYTVLGGNGLALLDAGTFAVAIAALATIPVTESRPTPGEAFGREFIAGFRHIRAVGILTQITAAGAVAFAVLGLYETVVFAIIDQGLGRPPSFFGILTSVQGTGAIAAGLTATRLSRRLGEARLVGLALAAFATGSLLLIAPSTPVVLTGAIINGAALTWFIVGFGTALQRHTPSRLQGRVNTAGNLLILTPQNISIAAGAALITAVDYRILLLATVVVTAIPATALLTHPARPPASQPQTAPTDPGRRSPANPRPSQPTLVIRQSESTRTPGAGPPRRQRRPRGNPWSLGSTVGWRQRWRGSA